MKLSTHEREVLAIAQHRGDLSIKSLAKTCGYRAHSVRYALTSLQTRKIIEPAIVFQTHLIGYSSFDINFSIAAPRKAVRQKFEQYLISDPTISLFYELGGEYEYSIKLWTRSSADLFNFFDRVSASFGNIMLSRTISIEQRYLGFGRKYLSNRGVKPTIIALGGNDKAFTIDTTDHRILKQLAQLPLQNAALVAKKLGIPISTVEYRINKLEKQKIIAGYVFRINAELLGYQRFRLLLSCRAFSTAAQEKVQSFCTTHPNVINLAITAGGWDYEIGVETKNNQELRDLIRSLNEYLGDMVLKLTTLPVYALLKINGYPFNTPQD